jgi:2-haloacid dehalogenase
VTRDAGLDALVLDLGGVVVDWDPRHLYRRLFDGDEAAMEAFLTEVCTLEWHWQHDQGVPMDETIPELCARYPEHEALIRAWQDRYVEMVRAPVEGMPELLAELDGVVGLYALTNMPAEVMEPLRAAFPVVDVFAGVVVSGEERIVKPERAIFDLLVDRFGLDRPRTLFVDDLQRNVEGAAQAGLRAYRFTSAPDLRRELVRVGVLD